MELLKAVTRAAGLGEGERPSVTPAGIAFLNLSLDLMATLTLRNRDRLTLVLPPLQAHLADVLALPSVVGGTAGGGGAGGAGRGGASRGGPGREEVRRVVAKAVLLTLRLCRRLLPYKREAQEPLARTLFLLLRRLPPDEAFDLALPIARDTRALLIMLRS